MAYHDLTEEQRSFLYRHLTELQHAVIRARLDNIPYRTIALAMNLDESTVRGHHERAKKRLADAAKKDDLAA